ncbi:MAG: hypothetical protein F4Z08_10000 [Chloroflexi bacterium]|nr:hypothetical protein [Chloroflexota bacterium]
MFEVVVGLIAGSIGATAMFAARTPEMRSEPHDTSLLLARISGGDPHSYPTLGALLQVGYGAALGGAFAFVTARVPGWSVSTSEWTTAVPDWTLSVPAWDERLWLVGLLYGILLAIVGLGFWAPLIGLQERLDALDPHDRGRRTAMLVGAHVMYGVILGALLQVLTA